MHVNAENLYLTFDFPLPVGVYLELPWFSIGKDSIKCISGEYG